MEHRLLKIKHFSGPTGPLLLIILDGIGIGKKDEGDAVHLAEPPNLMRLEAECRAQNLYTQIKAHGPAVGLPADDDMGNSEVGHNAIGAGRIYSQGAKIVNQSIRSGRLFATDLWRRLTEQATNHSGTVHFLGLLSDGNVHSHIDQLFGLLDGMARSGVPRVRVHTLLDGRDVPGDSALDYIRPLENKLKELMARHDGYDYRIASGGGRMYVTMDRYESDWKVVKRGWDAHVRGVIDEEDLRNGYRGHFRSAEEAIAEARRCFPDRNDQTLPPFVIVDEAGKPVGSIGDGDVVINFNFRGDRAIQISKAFEQSDFTAFDRVRYPRVEYTGLLEYDTEAHVPRQYLVPPPDIEDTIADFLCAQKVSQYAIAETHKFGHVTYFWNGNRTGYVCPENELYEEVRSEPSEMIPAHPDMRAREVTEKVLEALRSGKYKFLRVNFANGDMVGHTGLLEATVQAVRTVDGCVGRLVSAVAELQGITVITADHGNAESMKDKNGTPKTSHTTNPVGFWIVDPNCGGKYWINDRVRDPGLTNIAATLLNLLGYQQPEIYRESLISFGRNV
jgi:2,3-bisphosphoglycerate-independent phosphoglycerate mutase